MIIGITGKLGSGKSTAAEHLVQQHCYTEYSFASPLKQIGEIFGFSYDQLYGTQENKLEIHPYWGISSREFLQKVGTELFRDLLPKVIPDMKIEYSVWVDLFKMCYRREPKLYVISDVRFLDEARAIKSLGGVIIKTERTNNIVSQSGSEMKHKSEMELMQIIPDYVINNDYLTILEAKQQLDCIVRREFARLEMLKL